jgi:hypothetical protein
MTRQGVRSGAMICRAAYITNSVPIDSTNVIDAYT